MLRTFKVGKLVSFQPSLLLDACAQRKLQETGPVALSGSISLSKAGMSWTASNLGNIDHVADGGGGLTRPWRSFPSHPGDRQVYAAEVMLV